MDYLTKIEEIITKLEDNKEDKFAKRIRYLEKSAFTASELLMSVTHEFILMVSSDQRVKTLISDDVIELQDYCRSIGLEVK